MERMDQRGPHDEPEAGGHLWGYLQEMGLFKPTGMGPEPITYPDIEAWSRGTGTPLTPWETATLFALSRTFVNHLQQGNDDKAMPPWVSQADPQTVTEKLRAAFGGRARRPE